MSKVLMSVLMEIGRRGTLEIEEFEKLKKMGFIFTKNNDPRQPNDFDVRMEAYRPKTRILKRDGDMGPISGIRVEV